MIRLSLEVPESDDVVGAMSRLVADRIEYIRVLKEADEAGDVDALSGFPDSFVQAVRDLDMHDLGIRLLPGEEGRVILVLS